MSAGLASFYPIVGDADLLQKIAGSGIQQVQLRIKNASSESLRQQVLQAQACCRRHGIRLILNDAWQLALELGIDHVHLGQEDLQQADLPALRRAGIAFGISTHDEAELELALATAPRYVALGPVWPTLLKKMKWGPQGLERVSRWKQRCGEVPLVAIGGITPERFNPVLDAGADSAAVVTDLLQAADPLARSQQWVALAAAREQER